VTSDRIEMLLQDIRYLSEERYAICQRLRELALACDPDVAEDVKYGGIVFSAGAPFCGLFSYTRHVALELSDGARLPDPHRVLEGGGKHRRHIKLRAIADVASKHVHEYIAAAYAKLGAA